MTGILSLLWLFGSTALGAEYRRVILADGREVAAEIVNITATGMELRLPQGIMIVPPDQPAVFQPLKAEEFNTQPQWKVVVLPFVSEPGDKATEAEAARLFARRVLEEMGGVRPMSPDEVDVRGQQSVKRALAMCGTQLQCATRLGEALGVDVVVMGEIDRNDKFHLSAVFVQSPAARRRITVALSGPVVQHRREIYDAQYRVLFLEPPERALETPVVVAVATAPTQPVTRKPEPTPSKSPTPRKPMTDAALNRLAWAPVPGLPALARRDMAGFGAALGVAGAGAAVGIATAGGATYSKGQFAAVSVLSSYAAIVVANHLFGVKK
jgi:hypothetical protein